MKNHKSNDYKSETVINTNVINGDVSASTQGTSLNIAMEFDCMIAHYYSI